MDTENPTATLPPQVEPGNQRKARADTLKRRADIHAALTECDGNRRLAAEKLGIHHDTLVYHLRSDRQLRKEWMRPVGTLGQSFLKKVKAPPQEREGVIYSQMIEDTNALSQSNVELGRVMDAVRRRIEQGERARFASDPAQAKYAFAINEKGDLVEEALLRENYVALLEQQRKNVETKANSAFKLAQIQMMLRKANASGPQRTPGKLAFSPKAVVEVKETA